MPEVSAAQWDEFLQGFPEAHLLQTSAWGELKSDFGWQAVRLIQTQPQQAGAQILFRRLPGGLSLGYLPRGPVGEGDLWNAAVWKEFWQEADAVCRRRRAVFLKVEPDVWQTADALQGLTAHPPAPPPQGFCFSPQDIQPSRTLLVDLRAEEGELLGRMKQKTRYNIRLAQKKGVVVQPSSDVGAFHALLQETGRRDGFGVHSLGYYQQAFALFDARGECVLLLAQVDGRPVAGIMVFARGRRAWYFYGASAAQERERMPNYLLQWEGMRWAQQRGCWYYDLWGVPDADRETLEAEFERRSDRLWGVYRFKRGFGGQLLRSHGPWDRVYRPWLYRLYRWWLRTRSAEGGGA